MRRAFWTEVQPANYLYQINTDALVQVLMATFVLRLAGLRDIVARFSTCLNTSNFSSLSHALARPTTLAYVQRLIDHLHSFHQPKRDALVVIDGMPLTLPATRRHRCARVNDQTVGGGVIWCFMVNAAAGACPVRVLKVMKGTWNDASHMKSIKLAKGPVYVMDRGFYALPLMKAWLEQRVRFIMRARRNISYAQLKILSQPRCYGKGRIEFDGLVRLGCGASKVHPQA